MALKVVEEQASPVDSRAGDSRVGDSLRRAQLRPGSQHDSGSDWLPIAMIGAVVATRAALDLAWGTESALGPAQQSWIDAGLRALLNSSLVGVAVLWCGRLGGGALARLATAVGGLAAPGLWQAGWSWSLLALSGLVIALLVPLALSRGRSADAWICLSLVLSACWYWLASPSQLVASGTEWVAPGQWLVGPIQLAVVFAGWLMLLQTTRRADRVSGGRRTELPQVVRDLGLWIALASVFVLFALLFKVPAGLTVATLWLVVPVGLGVEMLSRGRRGSRWVLVVLAAMTVQLGSIAWWLLAG